MSANPYVHGWRQWDERYADLVLSKRNWQIAAGGLLLATIILAAGDDAAHNPHQKLLPRSSLSQGERS